jgi:hypothetical protein
MNLHGQVAGAIGAINPNQVVQVRTSIGSVGSADGSQTPAFATPGALTASIGGTFTASIPDPVNAPTTLNVAAVLQGSLQVGDAVSGSDGTNSLPVGTTILAQLTGPAGGAGTYTLSVAAVLNSCTVTAASTVLNVSALSTGKLLAGQTLAGAAPLIAGTLVTKQLSGSPAGGRGLYSISQQQTVPGQAMMTTMSIVAQVQALTGSDLRHMDALNIQGSHRSLYASTLIRGIVRPKLAGGDLIVLPDGSVWLVTQSGEPFFSTADWEKVIITLQNGA